MPEYVPEPKQALLHNSKAREIFYGGAAGGGKSHSMRWDAIDFCLHVPNLFACIMRRNMPKLRGNHIDQIKREIGKDVAIYNETQNRMVFRNGSILQFKHLEHEKDVDDIHGWELHWVGLDEASQFTPYQINYVKSRMRLGAFRGMLDEMAKEDPSIIPYANRLPRLIMGSNPGGVSHHYLKNEYIDPAPPMAVFDAHDADESIDPGNITRQFISAGMRDNPHLESGYEFQFKGLPDWQQRQLVDGDWDTIPGAFFDCWGPKNVIEPFIVPEHWTRFRSMDWGFRQPFWVGEWVVSDGRGVKTRAGDTVEYPADAIILIWEWYGRSKNNEGVRMDAVEVAEGIGQRGEVAYQVAGRDLWNRHGTGPSPAERMSQAGVHFGMADDGPNTRVPGWTEMYARIKNGMLLSFNTNIHFNRTVPGVMQDDRPGHMEDVKKEGEDHPADGGRMACMSRPWMTEPKKEKPKYWEVEQKLTFNDVRKMNQPKSAWHPEII